MRATPDLRSPLAAALALTGAALFFGGGASDDSMPWLGGAAIALVLVLAATRPLPGGLLWLAPLAALAVWCAASVAWSVEPDRSWAYTNRTFVYLAFAVVGAFVATQLRELTVGLGALLGAVCIWALAGKTLPWLYDDYGRIARLRAPVDYWNMLALLGAIALPLGLCIATRWRLQGTLLVYGWIVAIGLTYSRGGAIVAVLVVGAWIALSRAWAEAVATLVAAGVPAAAVLTLAFLLPGVTSNGQPHDVRVQDGLVFGLALLAGATCATLLARLPPPEPVPAVRRAAVVFGTVAAAAVLVVAAVNAPSWWDSFTSPEVTPVSNTGGRLVEGGSNYRWSWWKQSWQAWEKHPVAGTGAGTFELTNLRYRTTIVDRAREPHSLPVQFLSETGVVGLALFLVAALALVRAARHRRGPELALALALPAYLLHGLIDVDWDYVAVSGPVFLVAGMLAARLEPGPRLSMSAVLTASGVALAIVFSLATLWLADRWTSEANERLDEPRRSIDLAQRARSLNPFSVEALAVEALAEEVLGRRAARAGRTKQRNRHYSIALGLLRKATEIQPENAEAWYRLGDFNFRVRRCPRIALRQLDRFTALDPQNPGNRLYDAALAQVNSGLPRC